MFGRRFLRLPSHNLHNNVWNSSGGVCVKPYATRSYAMPPHTQGGPDSWRENLVTSNVLIQKVCVGTLFVKQFEMGWACFTSTVEYSSLQGIDWACTLTASFS